MKYAGHEQLHALGIKYGKLGALVADILGQVWQGIYHLPAHGGKGLCADWTNEQMIEVLLRVPELATFDGMHLTALVILCHDHCLRLSIQPRCKALRLQFHPRQGRDGRMFERHPTIEQHIETIRGALEFKPIGHTLLGGTDDSASSHAQ